MKNIYNIQTEFLQLETQLIENEGELNPELETALQINKDELQIKGIQYGYVVKSLEDNIYAIDAEIKRLQGIKKSSLNVVDRLKNTLSNAMQIFGILELKTATLKINFRKSEVVIIEDLDLIDTKFIKTVTTFKPDKMEIKNLLKRGEFVSGASLQNNLNIQIK